MKILFFLIITGLLSGVWSSLSGAKGKGGYDQFGEYVEKFVVDDKLAKAEELKRFEKKLASYLQKLKNNPDDSLTNFLLGNLYVGMNLHKKAIPVYKASLKLNPLNGEVHYNLARSYDAIRDGSNAIKHVKIAIKIFEENLYVHWQTRSNQLLKQLQKQYEIQ